MEEIKDRYKLKAEEKMMLGGVLKNLNLLNAIKNEAEINKGKLV